MTDRELLELAAKAAGMAIEYDEGFGMYWSDDKFSGMFWNPLHNDGDALRLAVKLGLTICNDHESAGSVVCTRTDTDDFPAVLSGNPGDPPGITPADYAATRRAIVLASAEIGAAMKTDSVR